jgi:hypothetical protein
MLALYCNNSSRNTVLTPLQLHVSIDLSGFPAQEQFGIDEVAASDTLASLKGRVRMRHLVVHLAGASIGAMLLVASGGEASASGQVQVTITNLTRAQPLSPPVVASHSVKGPQLFVAGQPASAELAMVAQDAINGPLMSLLEADPEVADVQQGAAAIPPGGSDTIVVDAPSSFRLVSLASMLVNTNDGFIGVQHIAAPRTGVTTLFVPAWDAGSEVNDEDCENIPGPACGNTESGQPEDGFVHIHNGVHGGGDLDPATYDWHNPVARIDVRRVRPR